MSILSIIYVNNCRLPSFSPISSCQLRLGQTRPQHRLGKRRLGDGALKDFFQWCMFGYFHHHIISIEFTLPRPLSLLKFNVLTEICSKADSLLQPFRYVVIVSETERSGGGVIQLWNFDTVDKLSILSPNHPNREDYINIINHIL